ncbi:phosphopyruvate hydratase [Rhodococcus opacus]|uniref:phosphopyruvate hydratase n=1 Tax=Rhodococcus opacus TaxID=37919 RepID=UPI0007CD904A|nr:phosphopyruvate hydratase [Rhodococcus opacus]MDX5962487.1 phosphopyruvate hydratase [Rhodococcus opacus]CAG7640254.1 Enolase [Rhodococcus opacus]
MPVRFSSLTALEILDSRGNPTVCVQARLTDGTVVGAGVPSGASTGSREAVELRDHDDARFGGRGVRRVVSHVTGPIADALTGRDFESLAELDQAVLTLDGTPDKPRLGANAIIGVSMAAARAFAAAAGVPLWQYLTPGGVTPRLPVPHFNVVNGGRHAANALDFQEFMIAPLGAPSMAEAIRAGAEVYAQLRGALAERNLSIGLGDEGGFAPDVTWPEEVLTLLVQAIGKAGYTTGRGGIAIALDPAASEFHTPAGYTLVGEWLTTAALIDRYRNLVDEFPIWSIEDGLDEGDRDGWRQLTTALGDRIQLVGDDNFVTNPAIITEAISDGIGNAALIKVNQIGTVTETLDALAVCRNAGYGAMISHRSGETTDTFIADLAVGSGCGQIKSGAPARGERVAKYNRLLEIAQQAPRLPYGLPG